MPSWLSDEIGPRILEDLRASKSEVLLVSPYVKESTVALLLESLAAGPGVTMLTTLRMRDFASGASDVGALLKVASWPLGSVRVLRGLHAKIFCRDWQSWWVGSANFTNAGMGIGQEGNVELMAHVTEPDSSLLAAATQMLHSSRAVSQHVLQEVHDLVIKLPTDHLRGFASLDTRDEEIWAHVERADPNTFMIQELPICPSLRHFEEGLAEGPPWPDSVAHDRSLFGVEATDGLGIVRAKCRLGLERIPVVQELDRFLATPRRFGEVVAWLHDRCEERPVPYRSEIKVLTKRLLDWMVVCFPDRYFRERPRHTEVYRRIDRNGGGDVTLPP